MKKKEILYTAVLGMFFLSCEKGGILTEPDISDEMVTLIAPLNNTEVASNVVFFDWNPIMDASTYQVQVAKPNFSETQQILLNIEDSLTVVELELPIGEYKWRVRAKNSGYETSYTSAKFKVVPIENFSDQLVLLTSPNDNFVTNIPEQSLIWDEVEGAILYRIQILQDGNVEQEQTASSTNIDLTFQGGESTWQVRAENGQENTLYSSRSLLLDTEAPNTPQLTVPMDGEELSSGKVSLEWTREVMEGSIEKDSIFIYRDEQLTDLVLEEEAINFTFTLALDNNTYYWYVQAFDEAGNIGQASTTFSFTVNEP